MKNHKHMTCQELIEFLDEYLDGGLAAAVREAFDAHLSCCSECREYLRTYRQTIDMARKAYESDDALVSSVPPSLISAVLSATAQRANR